MTSHDIWFLEFWDAEGNSQYEERFNSRSDLRKFAQCNGYSISEFDICPGQFLDDGEGDCDYFTCHFYKTVW
jgi:hypothetical protein